MDRVKGCFDLCKRWPFVLVSGKEVAESSSLLAPLSLRVTLWGGTIVAVSVGGMLKTSSKRFLAFHVPDNHRERRRDIFVQVLELLSPSLGTGEVDDAL